MQVVTWVIWIILCCLGQRTIAATLRVGKGHLSSIQQAVTQSQIGDSILVDGGVFKEPPIVLSKRLHLIGINGPVLDGQHAHEVITILADSVMVQGFTIIHSGKGVLSDPAGIKVSNSRGTCIQLNKFDDNFFGIYLQNCTGCTVQDNVITAYGVNEQTTGNGIHCWKCDTLYVARNSISGHRDGIYFEFVNGSVIQGNISKKNIRYGLHFMFSHHDLYIANTFKNNGAVFAVMYSRFVNMYNNLFDDNWGDAAYGLLLKEISDGEIRGNQFVSNTSGIFMDGASRMEVCKNAFTNNGWGMTLQANCMSNRIRENNFIGNTFDVSTNGTLVLNEFVANFWDKYSGYDLNHDKVGDIPFHPLPLFAVIIEQNPAAIVLFRSFMATLLDKAEQLLPSVMPSNFVDNSPKMKAHNL